MTADKLGRISAGILLYRRTGPSLEVLLAHPGGPYNVHRDHGHWTIPKGELDRPDEPLLEVALREFLEETGHPPGDAAPIELGWIVQKSGKRVIAWALEGDLDPAAAISNTFEMEWPPSSTLRRSFPEIDRVAWFDPVEARLRLKAAQLPFVERLIAALEAGTATDG